MELSLRLLAIQEPNIKKHLTNEDRSDIRKIILHLKNFSSSINKTEFPVTYGHFQEHIEKLEKILG